MLEVIHSHIFKNRFLLMVIHRLEVQSLSLVIPMWDLSKQNLLIMLLINKEEQLQLNLALT